jgi:hypothetical protein
MSLDCAIFRQRPSQLRPASGETRAISGFTSKLSEIRKLRV